MQCVESDMMDHYSYGLCSLGKRKCQVVAKVSNKKSLTKKMHVDAKVANLSSQQTSELRAVLMERLAHIEETKRMLRHQLEQKEEQAKSLAEERVLQEFLVACEMAGVKPDNGAVVRFTQARRKFVTAKRQQ